MNEERPSYYPYMNEYHKQRSEEGKIAVAKMMANPYSYEQMKAQIARHKIQSEIEQKEYWDIIYKATGSVWKMEMRRWLLLKRINSYLKPS